MNAAVETMTQEPDPMVRFRQAVAGDLRLLALLHDRELDRPRLMALWRDCYEDFLGLRLVGTHGQQAIAMLRAGLTDIPAQPDEATLDRLAAEYADIYLNHGYRASPCESVWLDEDGLTMQGPMFQIRAWYQRHGLAMQDWRKRTDDHLVSQLQFVAHLLELDAEPSTLGDAACFLDEHLLRWINGFAERVANRCETRLYAGLALLTAAYLDELRDLLAEILGSPRPTAEEISERMRPKDSVPVPPPAPYVPGTGPTW